MGFFVQKPFYRMIIGKNEIQRALKWGWVTDREPQPQHHFSRNLPNSKTKNIPDKVLSKKIETFYYFNNY